MWMKPISALRMGSTIFLSTYISQELITRLECISSDENLRGWEESEDFGVCLWRLHKSKELKKNWLAGPDREHISICGGNAFLFALALCYAPGRGNQTWFQMDISSNNSLRLKSSNFLDVRIWSSINKVAIYSEHCPEWPKASHLVSSAPQQNSHKPCHSKLRPILSPR